MRERMFEIVMELKAKHSAAMRNAGHDKESVRNSPIHKLLTAVAFHLCK